VKLNLIIIFFIGNLVNLCFAQNISNITATQSGKNILVNYNLTGKEGITAYEIKLFVSPDGGSTWQGPLTAVSGDVGKGQVAGYDKSITWEVLTEPGFSQLKGDNIQFKIKAFYNKVSSSGDIEMVWVEGGSYLMGSNESQEDEKPVHEVNLKGFYMGKYEVTRGQFRKFMEATKYQTEAEKYGGSWIWSSEENKWVKKDGLNWKKDAKGNDCFKNKENDPVIFVSHNDAIAYVNWLKSTSNKKYRLPTEAEWEYAAKGGHKNSLYKYAGSDNIDEVAWYGNANDETHPIGTKKANALGLFDMTGNVWEWCSDWYDKNYYQYIAESNPEGGLTGDYRVLRGGSFNSSAGHCRPAFRNFFKPDYRSINIGFRLAYSMDE
jgi:formylglycine-generating enzyme required for sulfatase activity